jgi:hypothetical protein
MLPESFLGTMLKDENLPMVNFENENEIFLDRNGRAFHYILEYYRTGKLLWNEHVQSGCANVITKEEIEAEIDYFLLPIKLPIQSPSPQIEMLNKFIKMLESLISAAKGIYIEKVNITFPKYNRDCFFLEPKIKILDEILQPFSDCGFRLLHKYKEEIGIYLQDIDNEIKWECTISDEGWHNEKCIIKIEIDTNCSEPFIIDIQFLGEILRSVLLICISYIYVCVNNLIFISVKTNFFFSYLFIIVNELFFFFIVKGRIYIYIFFKIFEL